MTTEEKIELKAQIDGLLNSVMETLAEQEHLRWARGRSAVFAKCGRREDGSVLILPSLVRQWDAQIATLYADLEEWEKELDREQVRKYFAVIKTALDGLLSAKLESRNHDDIGEIARRATT